MLWGLRMTLNQSTGFTPFFMVYDAEAILPIELDYGAPRVLAYDKAKRRRITKMHSTKWTKPTR